MTKKTLRQELRRRIEELPPDVLRERSGRACERFLALPEYRRAEIVMVFLSIPREVQTDRIALQCWRDLKRVLAPRISWEQRRLLPTEIKSLASDVRAGIMGFPEPLYGLPIPVADIDLVMVPGFGFDQSGNRLGHGRGFYDRFLSHRDFSGTSCALGLEDQVVEWVPADETDVRVHMLVTDARVRRFKR